jgi:hypothetical protein
MQEVAKPQQTFPSITVLDAITDTPGPLGLASLHSSHTAKPHSSYHPGFPPSCRQRPAMWRANPIPGRSNFFSLLSPRLGCRIPGRSRTCIRDEGSQWSDERKPDSSTRSTADPGVTATACLVGSTIVVLDVSPHCTSGHSLLPITKWKALAGATRTPRFPNEIGAGWGTSLTF